MPACAVVLVMQLPTIYTEILYLRGDAQHGAEVHSAIQSVLLGSLQMVGAQSRVLDLVLLLQLNGRPSIGQDAVNQASLFCVRSQDPVREAVRTHPCVKSVVTVQYVLCSASLHLRMCVTVHILQFAFYVLCRLVTGGGVRIHICIACISIFSEQRTAVDRYPAYFTE